jgi:hypothetical protein
MLECTHRTRGTLGFLTAFFAAIIAGAVPGWARHGGAEDGVFRAGAAQVDITPERFPVIVNGMFQERTAFQAHDRLLSRALVLDDGTNRIAIAIVDSLMLPRDLLDEVKEAASRATNIPSSQMLIAATHTHSAPSAMGCLGSRSDPHYPGFLKPRIVESIVEACRRLQPAQIGWAVTRDEEHTHCRRWILRPDRIQRDPFGQLTVRAQMHPGYQSPDHIGPAGPADPELTLLAVQTQQGRPLAVLANYGMHYFGAEPLSSDFCGRFGAELARLLGAADPAGLFVGMMSQGTSGDCMWMDYSRPPQPLTLDAYTTAVAQKAAEAYRSIRYRSRVPIRMAETLLKLKRRVPDAQRLAWAKEVVARLGDRLPNSLEEVYAREQLYLAENPEAELKLQALRIGQLGIAAIPNEVFAITGIKLKLQSPLDPTCVITLANGAEGYIPPPEHHVLGGYCTWPARTAGLEEQAEPKIVEAVLSLLEEVSSRPRRPFEDPSHAYSKAILQAQPRAYWRLGDLHGPRATDSAAAFHGVYEKGVVFYLPGPEGPGLSGGRYGNRCAHFVGGRVRAEIHVPSSHTITFCFWNGLPHEARPVTGYLLSLYWPGETDDTAFQLGLMGTGEPTRQGRLFVEFGLRSEDRVFGQTTLEVKRWYQAALVRHGGSVRVSINGRLELEAAPRHLPRQAGKAVLFLGGPIRGSATFEGRLDEVALFGRALGAEEIAAQVATGLGD